jgi:hypothetical protein
MTHGSVAKRVREQKDTRPELFCAEPRCLWRLSSAPCPKHPEWARKEDAAKGCSR